MKAKTRSRSTLFLMEQLVVVLVFAVCAAVSVRILFTAYQKNVDAVDTRMALLAAENVAESFKAFRGDINMVFSAVWGTDDDYPEDEPSNGLIVFLDENWLPTPANDVWRGAAFLLTLEKREERLLYFADIKVRRVLSDYIFDEQDLINLTVAARRPLQ
jgi:hypothetical protein